MPLTDWYDAEQLHFAVQDGDEARVRQILERAPDLDHFDVIGCTPLHYAVEKEHFEIARLLLKCGANINAHDEKQIGETPLGRSAGTCSPEMARFLIEHGADPDIPGWMQITAKYRAQQRKDENGPEVVKILRNRKSKHGA